MGASARCDICRFAARVDMDTPGSPLVRLVAVCGCGLDMVCKERIHAPFYAVRDGVVSRVADGLVLDVHVCESCGTNQLHATPAPHAAGTVAGESASDGGSASA